MKIIHDIMAAVSTKVALLRRLPKALTDDICFGNLAVWKPTLEDENTMALLFPIAYYSICSGL